jgi:carotenoid cleavage dioxygenase-like enzyme
MLWFLCNRYALRVLCNGVIETLGRVDYNGKLKHAFTAHPKLDPVTGVQAKSVSAVIERCHSHAGTAAHLCQLGLLQPSCGHG